MGYNLFTKTKNQPQETAEMKLSRKQVQFKAYGMPRLRFEDQRLTSFSGLILFQALIVKLDLRAKLRRCFRHLKTSSVYTYATLVLALMVHLLLGFRQLRDIRFYRDDPMVQRLLALKRLPDVSTISRMLAQFDHPAIAKLRRLVRELVLDRLTELNLQRLTLDFDGSVIRTSRWAEGTAVGFNPKKKGQRSYYPLFCTLAQTGQILDVLHRSGNVHDTHGALDFVRACVLAARSALPGACIEVRMDSAFFSQAMVRRLKKLGTEFSISVAFHRFADLKQRVESRRRWHRLNADVSYFELSWKPKSWPRCSRFLVVRTRNPIRNRGPVQLDLFVPHVYGYEFKVIVTNKSIGARSVVAFHQGRGTQEAVFGELKSQGQLDYVPSRRWIGNQVFLLACVLAHNLCRELQMTTRPQQRSTTPKRSPLWKFEKLATIRHRLVQRAGRLIRPNGRQTLSLSANEALKADLLNYLHALLPA